MRCMLIAKGEFLVRFYPFSSSPLFSSQGTKSLSDFRQAFLFLSYTRIISFSNWALHCMPRSSFRISGWRRKMSMKWPLSGLSPQQSLWSRTFCWRRIFPPSRWMWRQSAGCCRRALCIPASPMLCTSAVWKPEGALHRRDELYRSAVCTAPVRRSPARKAIRPRHHRRSADHRLCARQRNDGRITKKRTQTVCGSEVNPKV